MKKGLVSIIMLLLVAVPMWAQQGFSVKLRLVDKSSGEPVPYATVSLTPEGKDKVENYAQSDDQGRVVLTGVNAGKYKLQGILLGYDNLETTVEVTKNVDLGEQKMKVSVNYLQSTTVTEVGNPIIVKKDTIEHNVSLMKSNDNDVLEDLLKRLPGVEVSSDGTITANGKTISKIQIDGKQFFTDDPSLASKNLPAKIIEKVRVVEKKSEQAEFTGIDDGEEETVLDLGIKKGMMNGWFGNFMAGAGSDLQTAEDGLKANNDLRYQGAAMLANFTESTQLAFIGNANNTNNRGFNDMAASAMGGMRGGGMRGGQGGGGMGGNGISSSYMAGFNGGYTWKDKSEIVGNAMFNGNEKFVQENTAKTTYKEDGSQLFATEDGTSYTNTYGVRAGARADWKTTKTTSFIFEPNFNIGWGDFEERNTFATEAVSAMGLRSNVNDGYSVSSGKSTNQDANGRILWRQRLGKAGRTISVNARYSFSNRVMDGLNQSVTNTYDDEGKMLDPSIIDQNYRTTNRSQSANARLSYTEPLGKNFYAELNYRFNYSQSASTKVTKDAQTGARVEDYCSDITNRVYRHNAGFNIRKQEEKYNASVGLGFQPQTTINERKSGLDIDTTLTLKVFNWSPNARFDYNFSDFSMLRFNYRGNQEQPSLNQLMPVPDNSNPQRVTLGNLGLNPSFSHDLSLMYRSTNRETFSSINCNVDFTYNTRNIVNASWYDDKGVQYTVPVNNEDGSYSGRAFIMYNTPIAKSKFSIMSFTMLNANKGVSFVGKEGCIDSQDPASYLNLNNYTKNGSTTVGANETLRLTYRDDIFEVAAGGGVRYSQAWYTVTSNNKAATWNNNVEGRFIANIPNILNISTDARYTFYYGYEQGYNDPTFVWNAELSKQLFKNQFTLSLKAYDILNQSKNTYRTTRDNYVLDTRNNTLGRYIILSLTYRFGTFGGQRRGMGGPMGGPGGPMGGGPMGGGHGRRF